MYNLAVASRLLFETLKSGNMDSDGNAKTCEKILERTPRVVEEIHKH